MQKSFAASTVIGVKLWIVSVEKHKYFRCVTKFLLSFSFGHVNITLVPQTTVGYISHQLGKTADGKRYLNKAS